MKNVKGVIIYNIIQFVSEKDVSPVQAYKWEMQSPFVKEICEVPTHHEWKKICDNLQINQLTKHLFECLRDSLYVEDYVSCSALREEVIRGFSVTNEDIINTGTRILEEIYIESKKLESVKHLSARIIDLKETWTRNSMYRYKYFYEDLMLIISEMNKIPTGIIEQEIIENELFENRNHPTMMMMHVLTFFSMLVKSI